jgi:tetratricopeptide (TPR) repeat protein
MLHTLLPSALLVFAVAVTVVVTPLTARAIEWRGEATTQRFQHIASNLEHHDGHAHGTTLSMRELRSKAITASAAAAGEVTPLFGNLGAHHHQITTSSELAQRYFDEGLILTYGFNHGEAIRSFRDAISLDPACAMCYWGIALALGPNINAPMDAAAVPEALAALEKAVELAPAASPSDQAFIKALATRYSAEPDAGRVELDMAYANAMRDLAARYPDDLDAVTLFAEALMDLSPWQYWTPDGQPTAYTPEIAASLESVLARNPDHPGANHYYIHAVEASRTPERALPAARRLETLVPGAGHLTHMPSHVYWRVGQYRDAGRVNEQAISVDEATLRRGVTGADQGSHGFYALAYYPHNVHFLFAASHMQGRGELTLASARKLVAVIPEQAYREAPALEDFRPMPLFAMVRFGRWSEILAEPRPADDLPYTTGIWHWARGLAYLRQGDTIAAEREYEQVLAISQADAMRELSLASFPKAATLLEIAVHVLGGELDSASGNTDGAIARFEAAIALQDGLAYIEPPAWFYPVRHNLGATLLAAGRAAEAQAIYQEDLRQYPNNGWSLLGLSKSLEAQGKTAEALEARQRFAEAWMHADVTPSTSRF